MGARWPASRVAGSCRQDAKRFGRQDAKRFGRQDAKRFGRQGAKRFWPPRRQDAKGRFNLVAVHGREHARTDARLGREHARTDARLGERAEVRASLWIREPPRATRTSTVSPPSVTGPTSPLASWRLGGQPPTNELGVLAATHSVVPWRPPTAWCLGGHPQRGALAATHRVVPWRPPTAWCLGGYAPVSCARRSSRIRDGARTTKRVPSSPCSSASTVVRSWIRCAIFCIA